MFARNSGNIRNILQKEFVIFVGLIMTTLKQDNNNVVAHWYRCGGSLVDVVAHW